MKICVIACNKHTIEDGRCECNNVLDLVSKLTYKKSFKAKVRVNKISKFIPKIVVD